MPSVDMNYFTILENTVFLTMRKKPTNPDNDENLFRQTMEDVRPIAQDKVGPYLKKPPACPVKRQEDEQRVLQDMMSDPVALDEIETGEELTFSRQGIQPCYLCNVLPVIFHKWNLI